LAVDLGELAGDGDGRAVEVDFAATEPGELSPPEAGVCGGEDEHFPAGPDGRCELGHLLGRGDLHLVVAFGPGTPEGAGCAGDEAGVDGTVEDGAQEPVGLGDGVGAEVGGVELCDPRLDVAWCDAAD